MLENRPSNYNMFRVEDNYPYSIEVPENITEMNREITRNATLLIRLIKLIQEDGVPISDSHYIMKRIISKLLNQLELWDTHLKTDQEEYDTICAELEKVIIERDGLHIKRKIDDICEEEYSLKLLVADWSIEDLRAKRVNLENRLNALKNMKGLYVFGDIEDLYEISKNCYQLLNGLELEPDTSKKLTQTLSKILEIITLKESSTI